MQRLFSHIASRGAYLMGHPASFLIATGLCILWAATGPVFDYSDTWQLVINTGTTVLTFLAVFLIQNSQNRDGAALQAKLDEILRALADTRSGFVGLEHRTEQEIGTIKAALEHEARETSPHPEIGPVDDLLVANDRPTKAKKVSPPSNRRQNGKPRPPRAASIASKSRL